MLKRDFTGIILDVSFYKEESDFTIYNYAKKYNWSSDLNEESDIEKYFFKKEDLQDCKSKVLIAGGCFGEDFETKESLLFLLSSNIKVIISERFSLPFLKIIEDMNAEILLITLFRDTLYSKILYRLISRKGVKCESEIDENFKIRLFLNEGYDYTKNLSINVCTNTFIKFESFKIGKEEKTFIFNYKVK